MKKSIVTILLVVCMITALLPLNVMDVSAASTSFTIRTSKPTTSNKYYISTKNGGLNKCIVIDSSNGFVLPNCVGYAWGRAYEAFGKKPKLSTGNAKNWYSYNKKNGYYPYGSTPKAGSIACWDGGTYGHVAFVEKVDGDKVTITESRYGGKVWYTRTMTKSKMKTFLGYTLQGYIYIDPSAKGTENNVLSIKYNSNGADIDCKKYITLYDVNLRSSYSTSSSKLDLIPEGTTLTISEIKESGGYTWGKTTYNSKTGWCALASKTEEYAYKRFYLDNSGNVFLTKSKSALVHEMSGKTADDLYNYTNFGLKTDGYRFVGWCLDPNGNGEIYDQDDDTLTAEKLCPDIVNKSQTIMLYAIWEKTENPVSSISILSQPTKTDYFTGDEFDPSGLSVKAEYADSTFSVVTEGLNYDYDFTVTGICSVTVEYQGVVDYIEINVEDPYVNIVENTLSLDVGEEKQITASNNVNAEMSYFALDESIASVDTNGNITGLKNGKVDIVVEFEYNSVIYSESCTVIVGEGIVESSEETRSENVEPGSEDVETDPVDIVSESEDIVPESADSGDDKPDEAIKGDINEDGNADNKDVVILFRYISGNAVYSAKYDYNSDGEVNNKDVVALFRYVSAEK